MKKILGIVAILLTLAACTESSSEPTTERTTSTASDSLSDLGSVFGMSGEFKCTYEVDNVQQVSQVKNGKIRSDTTVEGREAHTIMNGQKMWMWTDEGCFYMDLADLEEVADSYGQSSSMPTTRGPEELANSAVDVDCRRASVSDSVFTPPSNCQDMGAMLKQLQNYKQ